MAKRSHDRSQPDSPRSDRRFEARVQRNSGITVKISRKMAVSRDYTHPSAAAV